MKHVIYGLYDPRKENEIRYVGYTGKRIERRLREHIGEAKKSTIINHRYNWLRSLSKVGIKPSIIILEEVSKENWKEREQFWIAKFDNLVNSTAGGEGLINPTQDVKDKISVKVTELLQGNKRRLGIPHTEESKKAISNGMRNSLKYKEAMENLKGVNRHANMSEDQKAEKAKKISERKTGIKRAGFTEDTKNKMSESHKGLIHPESAREKKRGSRFINNGIEMKQIKKDELLPTGWQFGMLKRSK